MSKLTGKCRRRPSSTLQSAVQSPIRSQEPENALDEHYSRASSEKRGMLRSSTRSNNNGAVEIRLFDKTSQEKLETRTAIALKEYGFIPNRHANIIDGALVPAKLKPFPKQFYGKPIEEVDNYIYEKTFCVVSKRFSKIYIHRYSASKSFFLFCPYNVVRKFAVRIASNQYFDYLVMITILLNCVFLALTHPVEEAEFIFLSIYTLEMVIKAVAKGFILNKYTYLRNPWNWLDFIVIMSGFITIFMEMIGVEIGNLAGLRTFRVLRALKTVSIMPGLKTIVNALLRSISMLAEVMALTIFCLMVFALFALQVYMGVLRNKCIENIPSLNLLSNDSSYYLESFVNNETNWLLNDGEPVLCGNITGARICPENYTCWTDVGGNPNYGFTNFDNFGWSMLATLQLITLDVFEDVYNKVIACTGPISLIFFIFVVFLGSYYLVNLMLAVVAISYEQEAQTNLDNVDNYSVIHSRSSMSDTGSRRSNRGSIFNIGFLKRTGRRRNLRRYVMKYHTDSLKNSASNTPKITARLRTNISQDADTPVVMIDQRPRSTPIIIEPMNSSISNEPLPPICDGSMKIPNQIAETLHDSNNVPRPATETQSLRNEESNAQEDSPEPDDNEAEERSVISSENQEDSGVVDDHDDDKSSNEPDLRIDVTSKTEFNKKRPDNLKYTCGGRYKFGFAVSVQQFCSSIDKYLLKIVNDPLFDFLITLCIVVNTAFLAAEHHNMSTTTHNILDIGNKVFTTIFTLEAILKLITLRKKYFSTGWNIFDLLVVVASLVDLTLQTANGLSVLRTLRLLRVFKLAQSWVTMRLLLTIIVNTLGALGNLTFVLAITIYIFAVLGMQLFGNAYTNDRFFPDPVPRWNFTDFFHSIMMIFRILCGEWVEPMWDCMRVVDGPQEMCMAVFLPTLVFGNFLVLNLFLALLLNSFNSEELKNAKHIQNAIMALHFPGATRLDKITFIEDKVTDSKVKQILGRIKSAINRHHGTVSPSKNPPGLHRAAQLAIRTVSISDKSGNDIIELQKLMPSTSHSTTVHNNVGSSGSTIVNLAGIDHKNFDKFTIDDDDDEEGKKNALKREKELEKILAPNKEPVDPENCFPNCCLDGCSCWESEFTKKFYNLRKKAVFIVDHKYFEWSILVMIFVSSVSLCFEDIYLDERPTLQRILMIMNLCFVILFTLEMLMKWLAHGFVVYFSSFWSILDFIIVTVSLMSIVLESTNNSLSALRSLRTLRALRPLRAISRWQGMKIVVNALMFAIPSIINVLLVCVVFWLIFSIMGVQFFGGRFYKCIDEDGSRLPVSIVKDRWECIEKNYTWVNSKINFDNVGNGYLALFQVATFEGWMEVMIDAVDAKKIDEQPERESNLPAYIYFVVFIICGSFFTLNLFIGVIIDNFNMLKKRYEGGVLDLFLTDSQKNYYTAMKKLGRKKPQKIIHRPSNRFHAFIYDVVMSNKFELAIFLLILLNMVIMAIEHYDQTQETAFTLDVFNVIFTSLFTIEAIMKMIGLRWNYFTVPWNVFDFLLVVTSIVGILLQDMLDKVLISPTLLRVVRVFRIGRILRLIKAASGIRKLLFALMISLPALFNIGMLLFLIMFIYALMGMGLFGNVRHSGIIDDQVNFETFGRSMVLLFRLTTSAGWNDVLDSLMTYHPNCEKSDKREKSDCGQPTMAIIYFVSYIFINFLIIINMYIAVILENFNQAHQEEEIGIVEDDLEMFYVRWARYDPHATQFIKFNQLSDFVSSLEAPLGIPKPNNIALVALNVPISDEDRIHCLDILHALTKNVLGDVDETEEFKALQEQMNDRFRKTFPSRSESEITSSTMQHKRQDFAARVIQRAYRNYHTRNYRLSGSRQSVTNSPMNYLRDLSQHILSLPRRLSITRSPSRLSVRSATSRGRAGSIEPEVVPELKTSSSFESASSCSTPSRKTEPRPNSATPTKCLTVTPTIHVRAPSPCPQIFEDS